MTGTFCESTCERRNIALCSVLLWPEESKGRKEEKDG